MKDSGSVLLRPYNSDAIWNSDRIVLRRARALASLDAEIAESVRARDEMRRGHLSKILGRVYEEKGSQPAASLSSVVDVVHMLTSFETFDALLSRERSLEDVTQIVGQLAATVLDLPDAAPRPAKKHRLTGKTRVQRNGSAKG